jgi:hypothetical protein
MNNPCIKGRDAMLNPLDAEVSVVQHEPFERGGVVPVTPPVQLTPTLPYRLGPPSPPTGAGWLFKSTLLLSAVIGKNSQAKLLRNEGVGVSGILKNSEKFS